MPVFMPAIGRGNSMTEQPDLLILKLIEKLGDANPIIRRNAAGALRLQGARAVAAIPAILNLLSDHDLRVRNEAERAIDHLRLVAA
jgi:HEAT repeat protein